MLEVLIFFLLAVIIGLMFNFFGYPLFRFLLPIWGFLTGLVFGFRGIEQLMGAGFISASLGLILGVIFGLILAAVAYYVYALAVYIFGITIGYMLGAGLMMTIGFDRGLITFLVGLGGAFLLALLFARTKMPRFVIIFFTAVAGAMAVIMGIFVLFGKVPTLAASLELTRYMVWGSWFWLLIWAALAGFGIAFQYAISSASEDLYEVYDWEKEYTAVEETAKA